MWLITAQHKEAYDQQDAPSAIAGNAYLDGGCMKGCKDDIMCEGANCLMQVKACRPADDFPAILVSYRRTAGTPSIDASANTAWQKHIDT